MSALPAHLFHCGGPFLDGSAALLLRLAQRVKMAGGIGKELLRVALLNEAPLGEHQHARAQLQDRRHPVRDLCVWVHVGVMVMRN